MTYSQRVQNDSLNVAERSATVAVIGAGQAGLSAGFHLKKRGFLSALGAPSETTQGTAELAVDSEKTFVMFDANPAPGGAWQHRWDSLLMDSVNGIFDLPGFPQPPADPKSRSNEAVPAYFAAFEQEFQLPIQRPVTVNTVTRDQLTQEFVIDTTAGTWRVKALINATGTWDNPRIPEIPGLETFTGLQLHTHEYQSAEVFSGKRVAVVGAGISAIEHLAEISEMTTTLWYVRRTPDFRTDKFEPEVTGRETIAKVVADVEAGKPTGSVVSYTGLSLENKYAKQAKANGALDWRKMFTAVEPCGVREADGTFTSVDAIMWATGFKPAIHHLDPLNLHNDLGGIQLEGTHPVGEPLIHLIGFGPSSSTVGANRAGRAAVASLARELAAQQTVGSR
ncbi:NAD(P)-binding domain-containing protein [Neomicrococcus aestuarii]